MSEVVFMYIQEYMFYLGLKINWFQDSKLNKIFQFFGYVIILGYCDFK